PASGATGRYRPGGAVPGILSGTLGHRERSPGRWRHRKYQFAPCQPLQLTSSRDPPRMPPPDRVVGSVGAIAQLGERNNGIVEVSGSIPLSSTIFKVFSVRMR